MPAHKGQPKVGGRKAGTPNKSTQTIRQRCEDNGWDYIGYLGNTLANNVPCAVCRGKGKTKFQPRGGERFSGERTCQSCWGSGLERIDPRQSQDAAKTLMEYCEAKRKPVDKNGDDEDKVLLGYRLVPYQGETRQ